MNKIAMVVGGANGVGAAMVRRLIASGYEKVYVVDRDDEAEIPENCEYIKANLICEEDVAALGGYTDVDTLIITAGVGRLDYFSNSTLTEIDVSFKVNTLSVIKLIKAFYGKIRSDEKFLCAVVSSIAGHVSSPLYAVYSATKAAVSRFIESANAELAGEGYKNRILDVSPGSIKGTRFHGGENDIDSLGTLAEEIYENMVSGNTLFIPDSEIYSDVIARYKADAETFGAESYKYKLDKNRLETKSRMTIGYLSGSFDLFHVGHLNLIRRAKKYCDYLIVGVHGDGSHKGKKLFVPLADRIEMVGSCKYVDEVIECSQSDWEDYQTVKYDYLFVGSDYKGTERFREYEEKLTPLGVRIVYFPYTKGTSSTQLRNSISSAEEEK